MTPLMNIGQYNHDTQAFEFYGNAFCLLNKDGVQVTKALEPEEAEAIQAKTKQLMEQPLASYQLARGETQQTPPQVFTDGTSFFYI